MTNGTDLEHMVKRSDNTAKVWKGTLSSCTICSSSLIFKVSYLAPSSWTCWSLTKTSVLPYRCAHGGSGLLLQLEQGGLCHGTQIFSKGWDRASFPAGKGRNEVRSGWKHTQTHSHTHTHYRGGMWQSPHFLLVPDVCLGAQSCSAQGGGIWFYLFILKNWYPTFPMPKHLPKAVSMGWLV